jgi:creatinine amidohydrolase/Fe(II)-dependent formamide hydrolase-like protein
MKTNRDNPLEALCVIDRLEVGPTRVEPRRLLTPYCVVQNGARDTFELIYRFEEDVFEPNDPGIQNFASVAGSQVALNYGLFCREIEFRGPFDRTDRTFVERMMANTAREIFVKKFLESNPFLLAAVRELPPVKRRNYTRAELWFPDRVSKPRDLEGWETETDRYAVLSSGGKDSLLSFGLLREIGCDPRAIFINESGRHWFTALNAYRHFSSHVQGTARVWTNADRVFAWILRHLPFVRKDFADVRSDEYPVRLWTVAVFIFGALALLRRHGIGRLIIGDEFDTTTRANHAGIPHYNGLYDQSRYFDNAMTRYFRHKGWNVQQFSLLRPLSEILIEKILVERYPELQRHQVSCHATHAEGERIFPCGACEKCRRIVGMLVALDADPKACGYSGAQIRRCLEALAAKGVTQEVEAVRHLKHMLTEKGAVESPSNDWGPAREHPEIMKLRFDKERSPFETIPLELRDPIHRIFLEHASGAVKRIGRVWIDFNPLTDTDRNQPYPFEMPESSGASPSESSPTFSNSRSHLLCELTWPEAKARLEEVDIALLPVGSTEQHGPHLPLGTDAFDAEHLAREVARACQDPKPLVLPLIPYGVSYHHEDFPGTLSVSPDTLSKLVYDIGMSAAKHGITKLVIINAHGGNSPALHFAAQMINRDTHIFTCVDTGETSDSDISALTETPNDVHAGEIETSTSLAVRPELVKLDRVRKFVPKFSSQYLDFSSKRSVGWYARTERISRSGVLGDPTKASAEKGRKIWEFMIRHLVELVEDLKGLSLDEIHQKRY